MNFRATLIFAVSKNFERSQTVRRIGTFNAVQNVVINRTFSRLI